jgi:hypothetical protein
MLIGGFWLFTTYLAPVVASVALGRLLTAATGSNRVVAPFLVGFVIVALLSSIPYAGPWIAFAIMLLGFGALVIWLVWRRQPADPVPAKA